MPLRIRPDMTASTASASGTHSTRMSASSASRANVAEAGRSPVGLAGFVRVKVDARYGAIAPGDLLTSSDTPGHAMRAEKDVPGTVIGKALEPLAEGRGEIVMLVLAP